MAFRVVEPIQDIQIKKGISVTKTVSGWGGQRTRLQDFFDILYKLILGVGVSDFDILLGEMFIEVVQCPLMKLGYFKEIRDTQVCPTEHSKIKNP